MEGAGGGFHCDLGGGRLIGFFFLAFWCWVCGEDGYGRGTVRRESEGAVCRPRKKLELATRRMERRTEGVVKGDG